MKKIVRNIFILSATLIFSASIANAEVESSTYTFSTTHLGSLDHDYFYAWNIALDDSMTTALNTESANISSASITFSSIWNNTGNDYDLWVTLLDGWKPDWETGTASGMDSSGEGNAFASWADSKNMDYYEMAHYSGDNTGNGIIEKAIPISEADATDVTYMFNLDDREALLALAKDGIAWLGLDPDCHFYDEGITLEFTVSQGQSGSQVPEPSTMLLFGTGIAGLAGVARRKRK